MDPDRAAAQLVAVEDQIVGLGRDGERVGGIQRLKDKLGTKALPTAELDLDGTVAVPVGEPARGVAKIATMLNVTRLHAAAGSLGAVGYGLSLARDYAYRREAFGRRLADLPVGARGLRFPTASRLERPSVEESTHRYRARVERGRPGEGRT